MTTQINNHQHHKQNQSSNQQQLTCRHTCRHFFSILLRLCGFDQYAFAGAGDGVGLGGVAGFFLDEVEGGVGDFVFGFDAWKRGFFGVCIKLDNKNSAKKTELPKNPRPISYTEYSAATHPPKQ